MRTPIERLAFDLARVITEDADLFELAKHYGETPERIQDAIDVVKIKRGIPTTIPRIRWWERIDETISAAEAAKILGVKSGKSIRDYEKKGWLTATVLSGQKRQTKVYSLAGVMELREDMQAGAVDRPPNPHRKEYRRLEREANDASRRGDDAEAHRLWRRSVVLKRLGQVDLRRRLGGDTPQSEQPSETSDHPD